MSPGIEIRGDVAGETERDDVPCVLRCGREGRCGYGRGEFETFWVVVLPKMPPGIPGDDPWPTDVLPGTALEAFVLMGRPSLKLHESQHRLLKQRA